MMNGYRGYRRTEPATGWTRIDMLLALYDGALDRLAKAADALRRGDALAAQPHLGKAQLIVMGMASGVCPDVADESGTNLLRLYEYVVHELRQSKRESVESAIKVLQTLQNGFQSIRVEAMNLEQSGRVPKAEQLCMIHCTA